MLLPGPGSRKAIAATLLLVFFTNTFAPSISYALTAGPTQPEETSFEPIDTTDMVSLQTGDFTYNIPLLEVPGPEGSYPISLSYHATVQPNEDASWVGTGWTLNTGSIDRNVNGYPDDWYNPTTTSHAYWAGGHTSTFGVGISVGIADVATVKADLTFAHDTYRGFGMGAELAASVGFQLSNSVSLGATIGIGTSPYDDGGYVFGGVGLSLKLGAGLDASMGIQFKTNFKSLSAGFSGGIGYSLGGTHTRPGFSGSLLGASISTSGGKPSVSAGGFSSFVNNSQSSVVSTSSHGWSIDIPVWYGVNVNLSASKTRYWTDETVGVTTWGSLNNLGSGPSSGVGWDNAAYDEYALLEDPAYKNFLDYGDPTTVQGGSFPDFDQYNVNAQGLGGSMRPYLFQGRIANQNIYNQSTPLVTYYMPGVTNYNPFFRFENDFSNSYRQQEPAYPDPSLNLRYVIPPMDASPVYGNNDGNTGFSYGSNLAGSRHVDIGPLIHPRSPMGYNKADRYQGYMIEGFSITNESGVTYHFGLPAYTYNEENYQEKIDQSGGATGNRISKPNQYAYTWYLTTITGPDYVDRNGNGIADDGDWGYWVDFQYGKWSNRYNWRNPSEGFQRDEDNQWQNVSMGTREVYYLNAVRTRSHIALFEKDIRNDAKGASPEIFNKTTVAGIGNAGYANQGVYNVNSSQSLKLSHIYLLNATDENLVQPGSGSSTAYQPTATRSYGCSDCELASNVLDKTDVDAVGRFALEAKAIRVIDFNYDYSLSANTTNSFDINNSAVKTGKLALLSFVSRGKGGANLIPPIQFGYELSGSASVTQAGVSLSPGSFTTTNGNFNIGDMIAESVSPAVYCGVITAKSLVGANYTYTLVNGNYSGGTISATVYTTKNPSYNKDAYDSWGNYKSDYNTTLIAQNENIYRSPTLISSKGADAWSLRKITSQLGNQTVVNYESDQYSSVALNNNYPFAAVNPVTEGSATSNSIPYSQFMWSDNFWVQNGNVGYNHIKFTLANVASYNTADYFTVGGTGKIVLGCKYPTVPWGPSIEAIASDYTINTIDVDGTIHATLSNPIPTTVVQTVGGIQNVFNFGSISASNVSPTVTTVNVYGGGLRVSSVVSTDDAGVQTSVKYNYNMPGSSTLSSGTTSYTPTVLDVSAYVQNPNISNDDLSLKAYKKVLYANTNSLYAVAREMPAPGVMYQWVTVTNQVKNPDEASVRNIEGSTQFQFDAFTANMLGIVDVTSRTGPITNSFGTFYSRNMALMKFTNNVGNVKRIIQYDPSGRKLSETINHYLHDGIATLPLANFMSSYKTLLAQYSYQGYLQERYYEVKEVRNQANSADNGVKGLLCAREEYPCIQTGTTTVNYMNGTQTSTTNLAFDFYSGAVTKTLATDAYGNNFMTESVPAYRKYAAMGLKISTDNNKNMLTQLAEVSRWKVDGSNNKIGLLSSTATVWSDAVPSIDPTGTSYTQSGGTLYGDVWRVQSSYDWLSTAQTTDGTTPFASFTDLNFTSPSSSDPTWKNTSTVTLYDVYSKALESRDINSLYSASRLNYNDQKVILSGGPANFYEIAYSGAEDAAINQTAASFVQAADGTVATGAGVAHTGAQSLLLGVSGKRGFLYSVSTSKLTAGRTYIASVWVKPTTGSASTVGLYYDIDGVIKSSASSASSTRTSNGWTLVNLVINGSDISAAHTLNVYCRNDNASIQAYVDDFRFQPQNASTTAYVYDSFSGDLDYILDNANIYTQFVYDEMGRLVSTNSEKLGTGVFRIKQYQYNYGAAQFTSAAINTTYYKNNCPVNYIGTGTTVSVPAGMFNSFISQPDADGRAQIYAQDYANIHGSCNCSPTFSWASGISNVTYSVGLSGTTVTFTFVFTWPSGYTTVNLGNLVGTCVYPTGTRTIPVNGPNGALFNIIVSSTGNVQAQLVSGTAPVGTIGLHGAYDLNLNSFYNVATSGTFTRNNCPAGQVGSNVTYTVAANTYSSTVSQAAANTLAQNDVNANGQNYANSAGTCSVACSFSWNSGFTMNSATISSSATTGSFNLSFAPTSGTFSSGTLGTITGGCKPSGTRFVTVNDQTHSGRQWQVTITSAGTVSVTLFSGTGQTNSPPPAVISGTYAL